MDSIFSKDVGLTRKNAAELFGDSEEVSNKSAEKKISHETKSESPPPAGGRSKKDRWKDAIRNNISDFPDKSNLSSPVVAPSHTVSSGSPKPTLPLSISMPVELHDDAFDDMSPSKGATGCRPDFIPSLVPLAHHQQTSETEIPPPAAETPILPATLVEGSEQVEHVVLVVHGVNGSEETLYRNLDKMKEAFEQVRTHWFGTRTNPSLCHVELINWKSGVIGIQSSLFEKITPRGSLPAESRMFINYAISDVAFYLTPSHCELIKGIVIKLLNERVSELEKNFPQKFNFKSLTKVTLVGYSLGSVILHDILTQEGPDPLIFNPARLFLWGSPLAGFLAVKDREFMIGKFGLPKRVDLYNLYHPHDPVAFRIEPLYYHLDSEIADAESVPFWKTDGMLGWGAVRSLFSSGAEGDSTQLVPKRRLDYVLQESVTESLSHHYSMLTAHYSYWSSRDVALFMLRRMTGLEPRRS